MPLETIALVGVVLLAVVLAAMVGSMLGRRFRTVAIDRRQPDSRAAAASEPRPSREAMDPTPDDNATAAPLPPDEAAGAPAAVPFVVDPPPIAQAAPGVTLVDPLARGAVQRPEGSDYTSSAGFANRLAAVPPPVATRAPSPDAPASRDREALEAATAIAAATAVKRTRRGRQPKEPKSPRRRTTEWILNATLLAAIAVVGAIAFSAFVWSPPDGEIPLPSDAPEASGIAIGSFDPGGDPPPFDPRAVVAVETPPVTEGTGIVSGGGTATDAPGGGTGAGGATPTPPGPTQKPGGGGGGGGGAPPPTGPPTPTPTPVPTPTPTPEPTPTPTPRPPVVAFNVTVDGLTADFANRTRNGATWTWTFGDGASSTARNPTHTYDTAGTYTVKLTATSPEGATDSLSKDVTVGG